ncbi:hypothetical protein KIN20_031035, partial [Parelaphostrongylus tenuis]
MRIRCSYPSKIEETLVALDLFDELNGRLRRWATFIVKNFVQAILNSGNGVDPLERFDFSDGTAEFIASSKIKSTLNATSVDGIASSLIRFFTNLGSSLEGIDVKSRPLTLSLGGFLQEEVMTSFLKCITNAYPSSGPNEMAFKGAMIIAEGFHNDMIKLGFFNDATPTFEKLSSEHSTMLVDRRCLEVLKNARELIHMPYLELAEVGTGEEVKEETARQYRESFGKLLPTANISDSVYPTLLQLPRCKV